MKTNRLLSFAMLYFTVYAVPLTAKAVFLKDGSILECTVKKENGRFFEIDTGEDLKKIKRSDVLRVLYTDDYKRKVDEVNGIFKKKPEFPLSREKNEIPAEPALEKDPAEEGMEVNIFILNLNFAYLLENDDGSDEKKDIFSMEAFGFTYGLSKTGMIEGDIAAVHAGFCLATSYFDSLEKSAHIVFRAGAGAVF